jgi:CoA:oxalate CoA-transferase
MARFGLDYPKLQPVNPAIIYCAISGYGQSGPSAGRPAYAPVIHASSGFDLAQIAHQLEPRRPDYCGIFVADVVSGTYAFGAIVAALFQRQAIGAGQMIDVSMLESMLSLTLGELQNSQFDVPPVPRPIFGPVATKDGYVNLSVASERTFQSLAAAAGRADWLTDPRFEKYMDRRVNWGALMDELEEWSTTLPTAEVQAVFDRHGVPSSPYRTVKEAMADPQLAHRHALAEVHDKGGTFLALNPPFRLTGSRAAAGETVAALGEDSAVVLAEAGYSPDEITALAEAGVTVTA